MKKGLEHLTISHPTLVFKQVIRGTALKSQNFNFGKWGKLSALNFRTVFHQCRNQRGSPWSHVLSNA